MVDRWDLATSSSSFLRSMRTAMVYCSSLVLSLIWVSTWILQSKCPMLQMMASFFIGMKCLPVRMSLQPMVMTKMFYLCMQYSTVVTS